MAFAECIIPLDLQDVERIEASHPEMIRELTTLPDGQGAVPWRRFHRDGQVLDLLAFDSEDEFEAYQRGAADAIDEYAAALGVTSQYKYWHGIHHSAGVKQFPIRGRGTTDDSVLIHIHFGKSDLETIEKLQDASPDLMQAFFDALAGNRAVAHSRYFRHGEVLDFDEFLDEDGFKRFLDKGGHLIEEWDRRIGEVTTATVWYQATAPTAATL